MSVIWHKVWYDLWHNWLRTLLVVLSMAVGVFAVGITFGMVQQMLPAMDASQLSTDPSHVTMVLARPAARDAILALRAVPGIEDIDPLNTVEVRWKLNHGDRWRKGNILMRDDYEHQTEDVVQLREGAWPKGRALGMERMHAPFYKIDIGTRVILEVGEKERSFPVTGLIRHPFVPPPSMYDLAWFFSDAEVIELFGIPSNMFSEFKFRVAPYSPENARLVANAVKERLAKQGIPVLFSIYQEPDKHWGRFVLDGMSLVMEVLAVVSMLVSVVLVLNTLTALITQQTNQIGIIKAIGGSHFTVTKVYLAGVVVYGVLSLCVALPLGVLTAFSITQWFLSMYNIDYPSFAYSTQAVILMVVAALVVPLLAALVPILGGASITVRQAIASYGIGGDFGSSAIDRLVERIGARFLAPYNAIALANTFRRKGRLVLTQLVLVTAGVMFLMVMSLDSSIKATLDAEFDRQDYDMIFTLRELQRVGRLTGLVEEVGGVEKADMWLVVPVTILHEGQKRQDAGMGSSMYGVGLEDPMYVPRIVAGRWLQPGDQRAVVINKDTAEDENLRVGDMLSLDLEEWGRSQWQVVGLYTSFLAFGGNFSVDAIYAPRPAVYQAVKKDGRASTLLVRTQAHSEEAVNAVVAQLETRFKGVQVDVAQSETEPNLRRTYTSSFSYLTGMLMVLAIISALVGGIGLMGSLWIGVIERTKEIGILRAIGALDRHIRGMFILEGLLQGLLSWLVTVPLALLVTPYMADALGMAMFGSRLDYRFNLQAAGIWLVVVVVISTFASLIPARNAARINLRQTLSYE